MRIGIFSNEIKDIDNREAIKLSELLSNDNIVFLYRNSDRKKLQSIIKRDKIELLTVLGGDGTILGVVSAAANNNVPILGINMGNIGFLTEIEKGEDVVKLVNDLSSGIYNTDERTLLEIKYKDKSFYALNEVLISRNEDCCVTTVDVNIDGTFMDRYLGDGVLVSTPTGSTAYSLSAGGPILSPDMDAFIINPVCPHSLHNRPIVISDKHNLSLKLISDRTDAKITVDGRVIAIITKDEEISVYKAKITAKFVRFNNLNFYKRLLIKMNYWSNTNIIKE